MTQRLFTAENKMNIQESYRILKDCYVVKWLLKFDIKGKNMQKIKYIIINSF